MEPMNRRSAITLGAAALAGVVAYPLTSGTASAEEHYRYMKIHEALVALRTAREEIEHAGHDFGGRKREALESIDHTIQHLEEMRDWRR
jgi:hypothetical protein